MTDRSTSEFLIAGLEQCRQITRRYGTSFYFATQFFPAEMRNGIYAVYAFARIPDEIVDDCSEHDGEKRLAKLNQWRTSWLKASRDGGSDDPVLNAIVQMFSKYQIGTDLGEAFLRSMFMDEEKSEYQTYEDLTDYMYGSAGVIGLMVTKVVGYSTEEAFPYAIKLGYAFQLTNFLRDIREDLEELGRVYMPQEDLRRFRLTRSDLAGRCRDDRWIEFMNFQIARNRQLYREAFPGIAMLNWRGRLAVKVSYVLYRAILGEIERAGYDVYRERVRTNLFQKLWLSMKALAGVYE
jgi:phytoene synthase